MRARHQARATATPLGAGLLATAQAQHQVKRRLLLDVVVSQGAAVLQLLAREDEALLVRGDALLVLDLGLDIVDGVRRLDLERDGLSSAQAHESATGPHPHRSLNIEREKRDSLLPVRVLTKICIVEVWVFVRWL